VARAECAAYFRAADVFLFPTHSDGFGLTQLEAQAWRLPIIASGFCGAVVKPDATGWVLPEVSAEAIVAVIEAVLARPARLPEFSAAIQPWPYGLEELGRDLVALAQPQLVPA
jgi:glycosyltransferase involved in cell wall biosynthesis